MRRRVVRIAFSVLLVIVLLPVALYAFLVLASRKDVAYYYG